MKPQRTVATPRPQRGGFIMGMVTGLLIGLALALGVALYITKVPVPFVNKVPQRTAEQDTAEAERNRNWDPNAPLGGRATRNAAAAASSAAAAASAVAEMIPLPAPALGAPGVPGTLPPGIATAPGVVVQGPASSARAGAAPRDPAAILAGAATPQAAGSQPGRTAPENYIFFVQAGAFTRGDDAEQQRAKLGLLGLTARVSEREQAGRVVYRVRLGPYPARDEADGLQGRLQEQGIESQIVRVERP